MKLYRHEGQSHTHTHTLSLTHHMPPPALPPTAPPPPQPAYVLRGHLTAIHALKFLANNEYLLSADASGVCILWRLSTRRAAAVWTAHTASILAVAEWAPQDSAGSPSPLLERRIITHGRDHKIRVWKLPRPQDDIPTTLPVDGGGGGRAPWMVASLGVNSLNFCGFGMCLLPHRAEDGGGDGDDDDGGGGGRYRDAMVAVPAVLDSQAIDIFLLPSTRRVHAKVSSPPSVNTGMAMALALRYNALGELTLLAGYESGHVVVFRLVPPRTPGEGGRGEEGVGGGRWEVAYCAQPHSQPVLSLSVFPDEAVGFITTSADSLIVRHPLVTTTTSGDSDGDGDNDGASGGGMAQVVNTRHSGLQGVAVRSDGKLFATAGWDKRFRVFSAAQGKEEGGRIKFKIKEVAVLKWHTEGCYAVAFAHLLDRTQGPLEGGEQWSEGLSVEQRRVQREARRHWLAGGAKDGKVSLWDIF